MPWNHEDFIVRLPAWKAQKDTAASETVHSMTIPLGTSFSIGGPMGLSTLSQQLQNLLTTSLSQPLDLLHQSAQGRAQGAPSGGNGMTAVLGPFTWVLNNNLGGAPVVSGAAARSSTDAEFEELTGETGLTLLPGVLIEGILDNNCSSDQRIAEMRLVDRLRLVVEHS
ncbi:unnamed protein product [Dibothriocephalus latus]|uniref:Uncharacterized protein n=1 Tax=Dibothriocephalus latus TaxID=60516 RepID=A0A3P7MS07_DIBLA|nr:unnamed protein product [Dibothriocephalus latus]